MRAEITKYRCPKCHSYLYDVNYSNTLGGVVLSCIKNDCESAGIMRLLVAFKESEKVKNNV